MQLPNIAPPCAPPPKKFATAPVVKCGCRTSVAHGGNVCLCAAGGRDRCLPKPPPTCENNIKSTEFTGNNTYCCSDKGVRMRRKETQAVTVAW